MTELVALRDLDIATFLRAVRMTEGSDLHLKEGQPPMVRMDGDLCRLNAESLGQGDMYRFAREAMPEDLWEQFSGGQLFEIDFSYELPGEGRFRVNCFRQRGSVALVMRRIPDAPGSFTDLRLPDAVSRFVQAPRGLVLVTGPTGCGKSTTLAAIVDAINTSRAVHIVTIEDPIEYMHKDKRGSISQRELRLDTSCFASAMRSVLRQDPDVILVGEIRDAETMQAAILASETGHLVFSTLHTSDAAETVNRVIDLYPPHMERQARTALAHNLCGVLSQRLLSRADRSGRVVACELLVRTGLVAQLVTEGKVDDLYEVMARDDHDGMQTFDQALASLVLTGEVDVSSALGHATRPDDLRVILERAGIRVR